MDPPSNQRVMLVTGASSGIGAAIATEAANRDWSVIAAARGGERLAAMAAPLPSNRMDLRQCDVTSWDSQIALNRHVLERFSRLDVVVASAGVGGGESLRYGDPESWREILMTNVLGVAMTVRANLEALIQSHGHVVLIGSTAGRYVDPGSMYSCSKWAVTAMAESLRQEVRGLGIHVTLINPSNTDTPFLDRPPPRVLRPRDVASAVIACLNQPQEAMISELVIRPVDDDD